MEIQMENKKKELKEVRDQQKKLLQLHDRTESNLRMTSNLENQLDEANKKLEVANRERDKYEKELVSTKSELSGIRRTLGILIVLTIYNHDMKSIMLMYQLLIVIKTELERQDRKELETKALNLIKSAKKKWEKDNQDKVDQLNKHIESQTIRITELCTSNNEMSSRLQRMETELETANAELHKLRIFQVRII